MLWLDNGATAIQIWVDKRPPVYLHLSMKIQLRQLRTLLKPLACSLAVHPTAFTHPLSPVTHPSSAIQFKSCQPQPATPLNLLFLPAL